MAGTNGFGGATTTGAGATTATGADGATTAAGAEDATTAAGCVELATEALAGDGVAELVGAKSLLAVAPTDPPAGAAAGLVDAADTAATLVEAGLTATGAELTTAPDGVKTVAELVEELVVEMAEVVEAVLGRDGSGMTRS